ncbi:lanthionine synthetase C-like protein [Sorangium cellulosum]|uniref:Lanthionine synthetase C-like protein n=1 Tax=Sorangium cellulosum TaxID=56 RepID=A0A2L0F925_SORCE|nr:LanC-like protein [Sorangium cellulosum]AUX48017.1 lanthionine synthetase C-like protein [Sorangium cellulosum]
MTLYLPTRHVALPPEAWDPGRAQAWLKRWAADALAVRARQDWPVHPRDAEEPVPADGYKSLYLGASGVWLALARVAAAGLCELPGSLPRIFEQVLEQYTRSPDTGERVPSWFLGESALLTLCCLAEPDAHKADRLAEMIHDNRTNPTREALWGAPGTMLAALFLHEATGDERWAELIRDSAAALWESWIHDEGRDVWLWEQDLYGQRLRYVGAGHGWAGNLYPLWRARALLSAEQQAELRARTLQGLVHLAEVDGGLANWPPLTEGPPKPLLQWCHGAPGIITSLRHAELPEALPLLLQGARLIAAAGPLEKGVGLCHGTGGNGAALLEMYRRTQDDTSWLERARELAMWALGQSEADFSRYGQWRYSLWTGDAGLACFLMDCLAGQSRGMPGIDSLW